MKEIKAILQPHALTRVIHALHELPHFPGLTILDAAGQGRGRGKGGTFVLTDESLFFHKKKLLEIVASDALAPQIIEIIQQNAHTGTHGDGLIIVTPIAQCVRIRTGEAQNEAL
jgi:nitrogen regulatory protein P-II 1